MPSFVQELERLEFEHKLREKKAENYPSRRKKLHGLGECISKHITNFNFNIQLIKRHDNLFGQLIRDFFPLYNNRNVVYVDCLESAERLSKILDLIGYSNCIIHHSSHVIDSGGIIIIGVAGHPIRFTSGYITAVYHCDVPNSLQDYVNDLKTLSRKDNYAHSSIYLPADPKYKSECVEKFCTVDVCRHVQIFALQDKDIILPELCEFNCRRCDACSVIPWGTDNCDDVTRPVFVNL